jgi:transcriptional regulator with XRE-family HTH domain
VKAVHEKPAKKPQSKSSSEAPTVFARRFIQARERAGLTLEQVAVAADIDDAASVRMSQYQRGVHAPKFSIAQNLARALNVPVEFFYSPDDQTAELLLLWHSLSRTRRCQLLKALQESL